MKTIPDSLRTFLRSNPACALAHLFAIALPTGTTLYATDGQWDVTVPAGTPGWTGPQITFKAVEFGTWSRGAITSEASTKLAANTMSLTCSPKPDTMFPGLQLPLLSAAFNHLFDGATVWVYAVYMPLQGYGNVSAGVETKFQGTITKTPKLQRNQVQFEVADPLFLLNIKVPSRVFQTNCPWQFGDSNCALNLANYQSAFAADGQTTQTLMTGGLSQPDGYFAQGTVRCTQGQNKGLSQTVKAYKSGALTLTVPWLLPVAPGDTFVVTKGCDKTLSTCKAVADTSGATTDNSLRFGGTPFVPAPSNAL